MSSTYNGDGTQPTVTNTSASRRWNILSSTNASPIVIAFSSAAPFNDGDTILVEGHTTNTNANGLWQVSLVDSTHFRLNGSHGNGVGGATGVAIDYSIAPQLTLPSDGDNANASSVNPAFEAFANAIPFLYERCGTYRQHLAVFGPTASFSTPTTTLYPVAQTAVNTWQVYAAPLNSLVGNVQGRLPWAQGGDKVIVTLQTSIKNDQTDGCYVAIGVTEDGGAFTVLDGCIQGIYSNNSPKGVNLMGLYQAGGSHQYDFGLMIYGPNNPTNWAIYAGYSITTRQMRLN